MLEKVQQRLDQNPNRMTLRRQTAEHRFGTIKAWMGATHFLIAKTIQGCDRDGTQCARQQHEACNSDSGLRTPATSHSDLRKTFGVRSAPLKLLASQTNCETNTGHLALAADKTVLTQPGSRPCGNAFHPPKNYSGWAWSTST